MSGRRAVCVLKCSEGQLVAFARWAHQAGRSDDCAAASAELRRSRKAGRGRATSDAGVSR